MRIPYRLNAPIDVGSRDALPVIFLHGIGNSGLAWKPVIDKIHDENVRLVALDLLGFGHSPAPNWQDYSVHDHARSIERTLTYLDVKPPYVLVGHSLGSLIAIEIAKQKSHEVSSLVLCSPPFYKNSNGTKKSMIDNAYRKLFEYVSKNADSKPMAGLSALNKKIMNQYFDDKSVPTEAFRATLDASIINQTSLDDAKNLQIPMQIIYGRFDPLVIKSNIRELLDNNPNTKLTEVMASHDVLGAMIPAAVGAVADCVGE